ncbi:MAG: hypothetical protein AAGC55_30240, partial [Myxococcota bacterium]
DSALRGWPESPRHLAHYQVVMARVGLHLYAGESRTAGQLLDRETRGFRTLRVTRVPLLATRLHVQRGRAAIMDDDLRRARVEARRLDRLDLPIARGYAAAVRAALELAGGATYRAQELLATAEDCFRAQGIKHMEAACQYRLGHLLGGSAGDRMTARASAWMHAHGVANPSRMLDFLTPGFAGGAVPRAK